MKIPRNCLYNALQSSNPVSHLVNIWKSHIPCATVFTKPSSQTLTPHTGSISIASWNCRGLHTYIQHLFSLGVDILLLQEHSLWPFQLAQLGSINKNYSFVAVCDQRLSSTSNLSRGCGGTAILRKKCFHAAPLSKLNSDRICGIQLPLPLSHTLTILGVYMPSSIANFRKSTTLTLRLLTKSFVKSHHRRP